MRVFVTKVFRRFQRKERIQDDALRDAITRAERRLVDADIGRHLIKQRIGRAGQGRSGGYRLSRWRQGRISVWFRQERS